MRCKWLSSCCAAAQQQAAPGVRIAQTQGGQCRALAQIDENRSVLTDRLKFGAVEQPETLHIGEALAQGQQGACRVRGIEQQPLRHRLKRRAAHRALL